MIPIPITPPAAEPVMLDEARGFLRLDQTDEDDLLAALITAARLMVEAASGRLLIEQSWRIGLDRWPAGGRLRLPLAPVAGIAAARIFDAAGTPATLPGGLLTLEPGADPPVIRIASQVPQPDRAEGGIEIDLTAGFGPVAESVPAPLRQAVLRLAARWFELRGDVVGRDAQALPAEIMALIAPYRRARL